MIVTVSGRTYEGGMSPLCTDAPKDGGWPEADFRRRGRGTQWFYDTTPAIAFDMVKHLRRLADAFAWSDSREALAEGRSFRRDADRIMTQLWCPKCRCNIALPCTCATACPDH